LNEENSWRVRALLDELFERNEEENIRLKDDYEEYYVEIRILLKINSD